MVSTIQLNTLEATKQFAVALACGAEKGQVLALQGDLGAGKTTFSRFLTQALGCETLATSPTFSLFQEYEGGRLPVLHGDFYRLGSVDELFELGWEEMLAKYQNGIVVVEWADRFSSQFPSDALWVYCTYGDSEEHRTAKLEASGPRSCRLLRSLSGREFL